MKLIIVSPNKLFTECQLPFMFSFFKLVPCSVDVSNHFSIFWNIWLLVVGSHLTLERKEHHFEVSFLTEPKNN